MGWGLDVHWAALAREHGWRCGIVDAVSIRHRAAPAAAALRARGRGRGGALVPGRAPVSERARGRPHPHDPPQLVSGSPRSGTARGGRRRVLSEPPRPGAGHLGAPPGARRARRRRRAAACWSCTASSRPAPRSRPARAALAGRWPSSCASRASRRATGWRSRTSPTSRPRASARTRAGERGRRRRWRSPCAGSRARSRSSSSTPTTPCRPGTPCAVRACARR